MPAADTRGHRSGRGARRSRSRRGSCRSRGLRAGRGVGDQHQRAIVGADPALRRRRRSHSTRSGPIASRAHSAAWRYDSGTPSPNTERRAEIAVGDRDVRVALDQDRAVGFDLAQAVDCRGGVPAVDRVVAGDRDHVGRRRMNRSRTASNAWRTPWDSRRRSRSGSPQHRGIGNDERQRRLAADSPSTLATPRPRPKRLPSFSIVTSETQHGRPASRRA